MELSSGSCFLSFPNKISFLVFIDFTPISSSIKSFFPSHYPLLWQHLFRVMINIYIVGSSSGIAKSCLDERRPYADFFLGKRIIDSDIDVEAITSHCINGLRDINSEHLHVIHGGFSLNFG